MLLPGRLPPPRSRSALAAKRKYGAEANDAFAAQSLAPSSAFLRQAQLLGLSEVEASQALRTAPVAEPAALSRDTARLFDSAVGEPERAELPTPERFEQLLTRMGSQGFRRIQNSNTAVAQPAGRPPAPWQPLTDRPAQPQAEQAVPPRRANLGVPVQRTPAAPKADKRAGRVVLDLSKPKPAAELPAAPVAPAPAPAKERGGKERKLKPSELKAQAARRAVVKPLLDYGGFDT